MRSNAQVTDLPGVLCNLATVRPDERPHVIPLMAVWLNNALYFVSGATTRKAKNLVRNPHCVITVASDHAHLVVEGKAV